ncbi:MAG: metal-dependent hydrolase [Sphingobacteriaceae bacterium]|nr:metal-dependent hydrolase [Sphingobacteriaceae bacterium]
MDSVSHIVIGAAIGEKFLGKKIGRWGLLLGGIAKSIPDFDLFYTGLNDPRAYMCEHRAHTHSLFIEILYALPIAWLLLKIFKDKISFSRWYLFLITCLWGHSILDWFTNFGTQLLLPFDNGSYSIHTLSIVDLLFTLPMLLLFLTAIFIKKNIAFRQKLAKYSLIWCGLYLSFTFINKYQANNIASKSIQENNIPATNYISNPTMLNNILWYALASNDSTIFIGEFSLWNKKNPITWHTFPRHQHLMDSFNCPNDVAKIKWFGDPYTIARRNGDTLNMYAVKFGRSNFQETTLEKTFIFHYKLFQENGIERMTMFQPSGKDMKFKENILDIWDRICGRTY